MQFTALTTMASADIPQRQIRAANTLFSTVFQLALGLGTALGAVAIIRPRGEWLAPLISLDRWPAAPFRLASSLGRRRRWPA
jgi:predicted MFS family arabinose efflux permease